MESMSKVLQGDSIVLSIVVGNSAGKDCSEGLRDPIQAVAAH